MSKNKHHNRQSSNNNVNNTQIDMTESTEHVNDKSDIVSENNVDNNEQVNESVEVIATETEDTVSNNIEAENVVNDSATESEAVSTETIDNEVNSIEEPVQEDKDNVDNTTEPEADEAIKSNVVSTNFYRVGTHCLNGKCINQVSAGSDLASIKSICTQARNIHRKTFYVFDKNCDIVYTAEYTIPKDNFYRVGTEWKNGVCINQKASFTDRDEAITNANNSTKVTGMIHHVFDPTGRVVFSAKKKLTLLSLRKRGNKNDSWYS